MRKKSLNPKATENRRESSRNAARTRRCVEGQIFHEMLSVLPFGHGGAAGCGSGNVPGANALHIDKISVIRISLAYIKLRQILRYHFRNNEFIGQTPYERDGHDVVVSKRLRSPDTDAILSPLSTLKLDPYALVTSTPVWPNLVRDMLKALDSFFLVISAKGNLLYLSDNVEHYLGIPKTCLVGHRFLDFVHPCDQREVDEALAAAAISHKVSHLQPNLTPPKTGAKFKGAAFRTEPKPEGAPGSGFTRQVSDHNNRRALANNLDDFERSPPPPPQQAPSSSVAAIDMIVRLKSLSTLASACTFEPPQHPRVDATLSSQFCQSLDPDTYPPEQSSEGGHCSPDTTGSTHQTHHQLRLNINFLQQQPNHKVMHLYGHAISKTAPRRAEAAGDLLICQAIQSRLEPRSKSYARPVQAKNCVLPDSSPLSMALQPPGALEDELSFYIFLVASPVCGTLFDKVTSRCLDKHTRNRLPLSPTEGPTIETVEKPLSPSGHNAVVSRHQMDMKILFFDEIVTDVLGYEIWQMIGRSFYDFIHVLDLDTFRKNVENLHQKGQIETGMYRLLVNKGGYAWVSTQASLVSYPTDSSTGFHPPDARCDKPLSHHHNPKFDCVKQVVCLHKIVSLKEGQDHILAELQKPHHQSHLWKGISLRTEQILFKNLPGSAPSTKNLIPNADSNSTKASVNNSNSTCRPKFATGGPAFESLSGAALYDGPVLALNLSQARALKRNHGDSQAQAPSSINAFASTENSGKVVVEKDSPALDLYKRAPCLAHEYVNTHASTKVGLKDSFTAISAQPAIGSHKRRKNVTATPEAVKNGPKPVMERKNWDTDQYAVQVRPRVILPKMAATHHRLSDFVVDSVPKGIVRNPDEDFFTRAPLAGDSCVSVDSSILLSPMGLKRKEITKLVHVGGGPVSKPLCMTNMPEVRVSYEDKNSTPPTIVLNGHKDENAISEYFDLGQPLDRTDSMENILDDIMSLQEDKGITTFSNEAVGHGQEGGVEEIKRALLDHGRDMKSQSVFGQSSNDDSRTTSVRMLNKKLPPIVLGKTTNPDIMIMPTPTPAPNLNPQSTRHLIPPSHILNSRSTATLYAQNRTLVPTVSVPTSQSVYHSILRSLNCTTNPAYVPENTVNSSKKRTDLRSVPTRLANGVLANLLRNGEDLSYGYKCFSPCPNPTIATRHEAESLSPHFETTKNFLSARRNSEPVMTTDHLLKSVMSMKPSTPALHVNEKPTPFFGDAGAYSKLAVFATVEDKDSSGGDPKYTTGHMVGQTNDTTMYGAAAIPPSDHDYMSDFARDYADGRAILGDAYGLEEVEDNRPYNEGVPFYLGGNHGSGTSYQQLHGAAAATLLKGLYAVAGSTTGLLNDRYDCNDELYNLNTDGMNVFEETNILDDV